MGIDREDLTWLFSGGEPQVCLTQTSLEGRVEALEAVFTEEKQEILGAMSIVQLPEDEDGCTAKTIRYAGVNVQVVNGLGATNGAA